MEDFAEFEYIFANVNPLPVPAEQLPSDLFKRYSPAMPDTYPGLSDVVGAITFPVKSLAGGVSTMYDKVSGTVRNTYLYLVGGIFLIGILAIVLLGAGTKFAEKVGG